MSRVARSLRLVLGASGALRDETLDGRAYRVASGVVVLIGGEVIHAVNSATPELVPAEELAASLAEWAGRPLMDDHPRGTAGPVTANTPKTLESSGLGYVFFPELRDGRLLTLEAWFDVEKIARIGGTAQRALERVEAKEPVEVSVGVHVEVEPTAGSVGRRQYMGVWRNIGPDHVAVLPEGAVGACSVEMGCGVRAATRHLVTAAGNFATQEVKTVDKSLLEKLRSAMSAGAALLRFRGAALEDMSDEQLRQALHSALFAREPGFLWVDAVFQGEGKVVYATAPEGEVTLYRRGFTVKGEGEVELASDAEVVKTVTRYEAAAAASEESNNQAPNSSGGCGCHKTATATERAAQEKEDAMKTKRERVAALVASKHTPYKAGDEAALEALPDELLERTLAAAEAAELAATEPPAAPQPTPTPAPAPAPTPTPESQGEEGDTVAIKKDELETLRALAAAERKRQEQRHAELVGALKEPVKDIYSEADLRALSVCELEKLAKVAKVGGGNASPQRTFEGRAFPRAASAGDHNEPPPAPDSVKAAQAAVEERRKRA